MIFVYKRILLKINFLLMVDGHPFCFCQELNGRLQRWEAEDSSGSRRPQLVSIYNYYKISKYFELNCKTGKAPCFFCLLHTLFQNLEGWSSKSQIASRIDSWAAAIHIYIKWTLCQTCRHNIAYTSCSTYSIGKTLYTTQNIQMVTVQFNTHE